MGEIIRNKSVSVGTTSVLLAPTLDIGQRDVLCVTNTSTGGQIVTISVGAPAVSGSGIVLYPGGSWSESVDSAFIPANLDFWVVASGASASVAIHERIKQKV